MRGLRRSVKLVIASLGLTLVVILLAILEDKCDTYDPISFILVSMPWSAQTSDYDQPAEHEGIIVVPAMDRDNVSWITDELPEYGRVSPRNFDMLKLILQMAVCDLLCRRAQRW